MAVDARHKLIVAFELTNEGNDSRQLHPMATLAKEELQVNSVTVVADSGYSNGEQGSQCEQSGITASCRAPRSSTSVARGLAAMSSRTMRRRTTGVARPLQLDPVQRFIDCAEE
jgi:hypothetical protein